MDRVRRLDLSAHPAGKRLAHGAAGYAGGYIDHYLWSPLDPAGSTREGQWALGADAPILNGAVYGALRVRRHRRARSPNPNGPR